MDARLLVRPLEGGWERILSVSAGSASTDIAKLARRVEELSRAYNTGAAEGRRTKLPLDARVAFSFPRDVPKGAAAVRELIASGVLAIPSDRPLRVVDLGAGLGAMTWGLVRALEASGASGRVSAHLVDEDDEVLAKAEQITRVAREHFGPRSVELTVTTEVDSLLDGSKAARRGPADIVFLGQVLSEMDPRATPGVRLERNVALITEILETMLSPNGALVIVEPALRERTRHLHAIRDRILERGAATVFAPCLHDGPCPALGLETEWCHEDLPIDLPPWVIPLARAAGLRWQGLTFSYLVLRKDVRVPVNRIPRGELGRVRFRVVSDALRSKGKVEIFACGEDGVRKRLRHLERDAPFATGVPFDDLGRGDIVTLRSVHHDERDPTDTEPPIDDRGRVKQYVAIDVGTDRNN